MPTATPTTGNQTIQAAKQISAANAAQSSQALVVQGYANSVLQQPQIDLTRFANLKAINTDLNNGLATAKTHANNYLNVLQPSIISNITNIGNYYALHNAVATALPDGSTEAQWIATLSAIKEQSDQYASDAAAVVSALKKFHGDLTSDASSFAGFVTKLNTAVNGDNGILKSNQDQLDSIQSKIDGAIAGIALSGLMILGGVFVTAVGAIADFVTAGASTPVVVGGIAMIAAGVGGEVASALTLKALNGSKADLLQQNAQLKDEVKAATGIGSAYSSLTTQLSSAVTAASNMQNAWGFLQGNLTNLVNDLQGGVTSAGAVRALFLTAAQTEITNVGNDITTIKGQMTGAQTISAPAGKTVGDAILSYAQAHDNS